VKKLKREEAQELRCNTGLSIKDLASRYSKSERTMYRWLNRLEQKHFSDRHVIKKKRTRPKRYPPEVFKRIAELKKELPQRSAPIIRNFLKKEFPTTCPSLALIQKYIREQGLNFKSKNRQQGYVKFERKKPTIYGKLTWQGFNRWVI